MLMRKMARHQRHQGVIKILCREGAYHNNQTSVVRMFCSLLALSQTKDSARARVDE